VAEGLYIVPEWSEPEDPAATNIFLTPGVAFGTGELAQQ
jgi:ribosomal protein L11 methylase PrmA